MTGDRRFRRTLALTISTLVVLVGVFAVLSYTQGPKLSSAQVDRTGVVSQSGQQLRLFVNQAVAAVSPAQVSVVPAAGISVSTSGDVIAVQFDEPLRYNARYTVAVEGVTSLYLDRPSALTYSFTTGSPSFSYLDRGQDTDQIITTSITGAEREVVFSAPGIQDFAVLDGAIAVSTLTADGSSALSLVNSAGDIESVALPGVGTIEKLRADSVTGYLGFSFTDTVAGIGGVGGAEPASVAETTLFTIDLASTRLVQPVTGINQAPLSVISWDFVPGTSRVVVQNTDQSVLLVDAAEPGVVLPLGQFTALESVSADGTTAIVADVYGSLALSLADGTTTRLDPSPLEGVVPFGGPVTTLPAGQWIQQIAIVDAVSGRFRSAVVYDDGDTSRVLFRTASDEGSVEAFDVSPNLQYVAIETVPNVADSTLDGYTVNGRSTSITTVFVDISSGAVVKSIEGFTVNW